MNHTGKCDSHDSAARRRFFHLQLAGVILNYFLSNGEAQSSAVFLSMAHEGMKHSVADRGVEAWSIVNNADIHLAVAVIDCDRDMASASLYGLARVQQQVVKHALHFAGIAHRKMDAV